MVQEFIVVRCYQCETFQVQQVKKINKWSCKCCNEKQSITKVFGQGKAADCRKHVQKLNLMRGQKDIDDAHSFLNHPPEDYAQTFTPAETATREDEKPEHPVLVAGKSRGKSKWTSFIDVQDSEEDDVDDKATVTQAKKRVRRSESDRVKSSEKIVPYSSFSREMEGYLDDQTPTLSASKSLHTLTHESYRLLETSQPSPPDTASKSTINLTGSGHQEHIAAIRKDISRFTCPHPKPRTPSPENNDIPKVSSRWSKFMCEEESDDESGCVTGGRSQIIASDSTVAQFTDSLN